MVVDTSAWKIIKARTLLHTAVLGLVQALDELRGAGWKAQRSSRRGAVGDAYSNPSIDTLAVVISVGHRISVRPFATAIFCVPLTE